MSAAPARIVVACGLAAEAKIAAGPGVVVIAGGGDGATLEAALRAAAPTADALVSFGIAGGLAPGLAPGSCLVASSVVTVAGRSYEAEPLWAARLAASLGGPGRPAILCARFAGVDSPLADVAGKTALHRDSGAAVVDMESHIVARVATDCGLPFAGIRVVADSAGHQLPHAATVGMRPDGGVAIAAVLLSLARDPRQVPGLIRTALDARAAFAGLFRSRQLLDGCFGFDADGGGLVDLGDPLLDMA